MGPIVLLTDFGSKDPYVGVMKGVIAGIAPGAPVIDLSHGIARHDIRAAAFCLRTSASFFPPRSIFVVVVDPGVGGARRILWARSDGRQYLAPDNGALAWLEKPPREFREVDVSRWGLSRVSGTFHGRDVFAPAAARLWLGAAPSRLGPAVKPARTEPFPPPRRSRGRLTGEIVYVDGFGNAVTNIEAAAVGGEARVLFRGKDAGRLLRAYCEAPDNRAVALAASSGYVELAIKEANFAEEHRVRIGEAVEVHGC